MENLGGKGERTMTKLGFLGVAVLALVMLAPEAMAREAAGQLVAACAELW